MNVLYLAANPFFEAYAHSDWFGKTIFIVLFALSIISWIILVNKVWVTRLVRNISADMQDSFEKQKHNVLHVEMKSQVYKEIPNPYYEMYQVVKRHTLDMLNKNRWFQENQSDGSSNGNGGACLSPTDIESLDGYLDVVITNQVKSLEKNLFVLPTVVTLAPFLGLLGTVWGILLTFSALQSNAIVTSNVVVLSGLSMALATTVLGLVVAIPALIAYSYLRNNLKNFETDMEHFSHMMLAAVEIQYRKVDVE